MKRKISAIILISYLGLCVTPFLLNNDKETEKNNTNICGTLKNINLRNVIYQKINLEEQHEQKENNVNKIEEASIENTQYSEERVYAIGWLSENSNIRCEADLSSNVLNVLPKNTKIQYSEYNEEWYMVKINDEIGYVWKELVSNEEIKYTNHSVPENKIKTFMSYLTITSVSSDQYKLQKIAYTGNYGIRQVDGRYCIAVGSAYTTKIGQHIDLVLENGVIIPCILADCKADKDTNYNNTLTIHDGSLVEFVVDVPRLDEMVRLTGDVSTACEDWKSNIINIIVYEESEDF